MPDWIPPWLQPADPATHRARGFSLGLEAASQRAANKFREAQLAREDQAREIQQAQNAAEYGLRKKAQDMAEQEQQRVAAQAASQAAARQSYRQAIASGMDPMQALIMHGPDMGQQGTPEAAAIRAQLQSARQNRMPQVVDIGGGRKALIGPSGEPRIIPEQAKYTDENQTIAGTQVPVQRNSLTRLLRYPPVQLVAPSVPGYVSPSDKLQFQAQNQQQVSAQKARQQWAMSRMKTIEQGAGQFLSGDTQPKEGDAMAKMLPGLIKEYNSLKAELAAPKAPAPGTPAGQATQAAQTAKPTSFVFDPNQKKLIPAQAQDEEPANEPPQE
jgi:hypothetical protein